MLECHVFSSLSHDIVLGFYWLHAYSPCIDWWACTLLVKVPSGHCLLAALTCNYIVHIELASLDSIFKEVDDGVVAWFTLICPTEPPDAIGACGTLSGGESGDA